MTYETRDSSQQDGAPLEAYKFVSNRNTYYYTNGDEQITVDNLVYDPLPGIDRSNIDVSSETDNPVTVTVTMPITAPLMQENAFAATPETMAVTIYEVHRDDDDFEVIFSGEIGTYSVAGRTGEANAYSRATVKLNTEIPRVAYEYHCNHLLYDARCKVVRSEHSTTSTITAVTPDGIGVLDDGFVDETLRGGDILHAPTGERRLILNNLANTLTISSPFTEAAAGDQVVISRGCDHSLATCKATFNNVPNFGGFPLIPDYNPFKREN